MNALYIAVFAIVAACATAKPGVSHVGSVVSGPSGVVTDHGPVGPVVGPGVPYYAGPAVAVAPAVAYAAPVAKAVVAGPAFGVGYGGYDGGYGAGFGAGFGYGGYAGYGGYGGYGFDGGYAGAGHGLIGIGGVVVKGPPTVPATIAGPSGKIVATGLWGPTLATGHGGHGHGW